MRIKKESLDAFVTVLFIFGLLVLSFLGHCSVDVLVLVSGLFVASLGNFVLIKTRKKTM